jgi:hypothetical protein
MLDILSSPDHVAAYRISGKLDGDDFDRMKSDLDARLERHQKIGAMVDLTDWDGFTLEALGKDLSLGLAYIGKLPRFPREAIVTDSEALANFYRTVRPLVPYVEVRTFTSRHRVSAMDWAAEI